MSVTMLYLSYSWLIFEAARRTVAPAWVRLVARNTVIVFIAHMPLYYGLESVIAAKSSGTRLTIEFLLCFFGLVLLSEILRRSLNLAALRERIPGRLGWSHVDQMFART
jgi:hypothetical protein